MSTDYPLPHDPAMSTIVYLNFTTGEVRQLSLEEHARMVMEYSRRCTFKNGVCYVDCEPPEEHNAI